ncbi:hypothetical protein [Streptomyces sp. NPDC056479]|uniref:hypothetical protein n=1 Tax=unclassified Streptomyces TaxID=2593676 RepID=UPI00367DDFEA
MSRPPEQENGMYGANGVNHSAAAPGVHGAHWESDGTQVPPNVYHPQVEPAPVYEEYSDPAAAHGWQNAYDETTEMPPVADGADGAREDPRADGVHGAGGGYDYVYEDGYDYADAYAGESGRGRGRRRARRKPGVWRSPRFAVAAGAVGALSAAALIAGFSLSGSSSEGGTRTKDDRTGATSGDAVTPGEPSPGVSAGARAPEGAGPSQSPSPSDPASPSSSDDGGSDGKTVEPSADPTAAGTAPSEPAATPTATAPGNSGNNPGRGQGGTKKPG